MREIVDKTLLIAALAIFPAPAFCGPVNYCFSLSELASQVKDCQENVYFAKAAQNCLGKIEKDIEAQKLTLSGLMLQNTAAAASAQAGRIANNSQNLASLQASIDTLMGYALQARQEVISYSENFVYAGPISREMAQKLKLERFLQKIPCYKRNRAAIAQVVNVIDQRVEEFRKVGNTARANQAVDSANLKRLDAGSLAAPVSNRAPASVSAPAKLPPKAKQGPSSITGTEKIGESDRALQRLSR